MEKSTIKFCHLDRFVQVALEEQIRKNPAWRCVQEGPAETILCGSAAALGDIRTKAPYSFVMLLSERSSPNQDQEMADVVLASPFRLGTVLSQVEKHRIRRLTDPDLTFGDFVVSPRHRQLTQISTQNTVDLTDKEIQILQFLYSHKNEPVSRDILLEKVWDYSDKVTTHTLETHIYRLRQKIERDSAAPEILVTVSGGYSLIF